MDKKLETLNFKEEIRNLTFAKEMYINELIALLKYEDFNMIELNKCRALSDIDLMISTMQQLKEKIKL